MAEVLLYAVDSVVGGQRYLTSYYWDTVTRVVTSPGPVYNPGAPGLVYSKPVDEVVDTYCLDPLVPPFTLREVFHDGAGGVIYTDTDGAAGCGPTGCTLAITGAAITPEGVNTLGQLIVGTSGAIPDPAAPTSPRVEYSLDGFQNHKQFSSNLRDLPAGRYTVTVREVRPGGCTARATFVVPSPYGLRYRLPFVAFDGAECLAEIHLRGYAGAAETIRGSAEPVVLSWPGDATGHAFDQPVRGAECDLTLKTTYTGQCADLYGSDERQSLVLIYRGEEEIWRGWLLPEQWTAPLLFPPFDTTFRATDGVGALADTPLGDPAGNRLPAERLSHLDTFKAILALAGHDNTLPLVSGLSLFHERMPTADVNADALAHAATWTHGWVEKPGTATEKALPAATVLRSLLDYYAARLFQWRGAWHVARLSDDGRADPGARRVTYATDGSVAVSAYRPETRIYPVGFGSPIWIDAVQEIGLRPAVKLVSIAGLESGVVNLFPEGSTWPVAATRPGGTLGNWGGNLVHSVGPDPSDTSATPKRVLLIPALPAPVPPATLPTPTTAYISRKIRVSALTGLNLTFDVETAAGWPLPYVPEPGASPRQPEFVIAIGVDGDFSTLSGVTVDDNGLPASNTYYSLHAKRQRWSVALVGDNVYPPAASYELEARLYPWEMPDGLVIREIKASYGNGSWDYEIFTSNPETSSADRSVIVIPEPAPVSETRANTRIAHATRTDDKLAMGLTDANDYAQPPFGGGGVPGFRLGVFDVTTGLPVRRWVENAVELAENPSAGRAMADLVARDRALWQRQPARVIRGTLKGWLPYGPGTLLADLYAGPNLFAITECRYLVASAKWEITAVEVNTARATALPAPGLLLETGGAILAETLAPLLLETA